MTRLTEDQWGVAFDVEDLEAASSLADDIGLPITIAGDHAGCPEVIEVPPRNDATGCAAQFMIWREADKAEFTVMELPGNLTQSFGDLMLALRFCREQRGADWPSVA